MVEDRFLLHASDRENWRLRNVEEHPLDPGWEVGKYCRCHPSVRAKIELGARTFDVVVRDGKGVIRSAFVIRGAQGEGNSRVLHFDDFYFADGEPMKLPGPFIQYRLMKMKTWIKKYGRHSLWDKIADRYTHYKKGSKPRSIDKSSWSRMVAIASKNREEMGYASNSSSCRSKCK